MPISTKVSGAWQTVTRPAVKVSGTWRPAGGVWVRVSGVWQKAYSAVNLTNRGPNAWVNAGSATAQLQLNSDGSLKETDYSTNGNNTLTAVSGQWKLGGTNSDYEARMTVNTGSLTSGPTGTWDALSTTRDWTLVRSTSGVVIASCTLEIRMAGSTTVIASATIDFEAEKI